MVIDLEFPGVYIRLASPLEEVSGSLTLLNKFCGGQQKEKKSSCKDPQTLGLIVQVSWS